MPRLKAPQKPRPRDVRKYVEDAIRRMTQTSLRRRTEQSKKPRPPSDAS